MISTHERTIVSILDAVFRRNRAHRALRVATAAVPLLALAFAWWVLAGGWFALALLAAAMVAVWQVKSPGRFIPAVAVEKRMPALQNVLVTAAELLDGTLHTSPAFHERVIADAGTAVARVSAKEVVPLGRPASVLAVAAAVAVMLVALAAGVEPHDAQTRGDLPGGTAAATAALSMAVRVLPPSYLQQRPRELRDPEAIEVIAGSSVEASAPGARLRWVDERGSGRAAEATLRVQLRDDGFIAVEQHDVVTRVVPVTVRADETPRVAVVRPGGDLVLPAAAPVAVSASATDDHGLLSAELRYTRVSGSGEQFEFTNGVVPLVVRRPSARSWTLEAELPLARMGAVPGDAIVFRIAARDARAAAGEGLSDAVVVEIAGPGRTVGAGAAIDPTEDTFALSQQMILLKLKRLHAARRSLGASDLLARSQSLAAEQRSVRALFVFMLGGEVEDEEVEAAHSHEIQEGRLEDTSRRDLVTAVNLMSRVEQHLTAAEIVAALPPAQAAVDAVQRAFGRRRYFLRTMPLRMRIDPTRRLTAETTNVDGVSVAASRPPQRDAALATLEDLIRLASLDDEELRKASLADVAARVLAVDPRSNELQRLAQDIQRAGGNPRAAVDEAIAAIAAREQTRFPGTLRPGEQPPALAGAWADAWRRAGSP